MDPRVIEQIEPFTAGLQKLRELQPYRWRYNGLGGTEEGATGVGLLADDARVSLPEAVRHYHARLQRHDDELTAIAVVGWEAVVWMLLNAVRELDRELQALKGGK